MFRKRELISGVVCLVVAGCATVRPLYLNTNESYADHPGA
jgi:hypothetical protein